MKTLTLILLVSVLSPCFLYAQKEADNWYFGSNAGITFKNGTPVALTDGQLSQREGVATISDINGNLLFYTEGATIWNKNHQAMPNGTGLMGQSNSAQSAVIVPMPGNPELYYVFTVPDWYNSGNGLRYSIVDMRLNGGLGDVVATSKNILLNANVNEQVTSVFHEDCQDIWIVSHEKGNTNFLAYRLSATGLETTPVISSTGMLYNGHNRFGYLRLSADGTKLCSTLGGGGTTSETVQLYDFDKATGVISNPITLALNSDISNAYASEFSADGTKLYVVTFNLSVLYQYDLSSGIPATIINSRYNVATGYSSIKSCLQMGPDKKIYVSKSGDGYLGVIENPNGLRNACNYVDDGVWLAGRSGQLGLPNFMQGFFFLPYLGADTAICKDATLVLDATTHPGETYTWQDGSTSNLFTVTQPGKYWVEVNNQGCIKTDTININRRPPPAVDLGNDTVLCGSGNVVLDGSVPGTGAAYQWQDGSTNSTYTVTVQGDYWVKVTQDGCSNADTIKVTSMPLPVVNLGNDTTICDGTAISLSPYLLVGNTYLWQDGSSGATYNVATAGEYWVEVSNSGCSRSDTIEVFTASAPIVDIGNDTTVCGTGQVTLDASASGPGVTYAWQDGSTSATYTAGNAGDYRVTVTSSNGCTAADTVTIDYKAIPSVNLGNDTTLCEGIIYTLDAGFVTGHTYEWQNGSIAPTLAVVSPGTYWVAVSDATCTGYDTIDIAYQSRPVVDIGPDSTICGTTSIVLDASGAGSGVTYEWQDASHTATYTVHRAGDYWVEVTSVNGCSNGDTVTIDYKDFPVADLGEDVSTCAGSPITLDAYTAPGNTYEWQDGSGSPTLNATTTGDYWVKVSNGSCQKSDTIALYFQPLPTPDLGTDRLLCSVPFSLTPGTMDNNALYQWQDGSSNSTYSATEPGIYWVTITENDCSNSDTVTLVDPSLQLIADTAICEKTPLVLEVAKLPGATYQWQDGSANTWFTVTQAGTYTVTAQTTCGVLKESVTIATYNCDCRVRIPNAFSPNRDNHNDAFRPVANYCDFETYDFKVYNRWGELIFQSKNPLNGWKGVYKGEHCDIGLYVYTFTYRFSQAEPLHTEKGTVALVR